MNAGREECFIGVDIADAADKTLVQEQRLDGAFSSLEARKECLEIKLQGVGADALLRLFGVEFEAAELAHVVEQQHTVFEFEEGAGVFARGGVPKEIAGHTEMDIEQTTVELDQNLLAMTADANDCGSGKSAFGCPVIAASDSFGGDRRRSDSLTADVAGDRADDGFHFGQFRQSQAPEL